MAATDGPDQEPLDACMAGPGTAPAIPIPDYMDGLGPGTRRCGCQ